jgi:hypothetical protein
VLIRPSAERGNFYFTLDLGGSSVAEPTAISFDTPLPLVMERFNYLRFQ